RAQAHEGRAARGRHAARRAVAPRRRAPGREPPADRARARCARDVLADRARGVPHRLCHAGRDGRARRNRGRAVATARAPDPVRDAPPYPQGARGEVAMTYTREDIQLYLIGAYDGDVAALERALADDPDLRALATEEASFEELLREAGAAAKFCPGCKD